ncbi:hypothetical protein CTRU02_208932 [Colletotrichum truncatum]|uniref:Uncharacterized protein n=1 Tax=Colletotrichum truncatum TaxID=5467 RepID=A0ACC3YXV0_COLTU
MGERTGSRVFQWVWSYVTVFGVRVADKQLHFMLETNMRTTNISYDATKISINTPFEIKNSVAMIPFGFARPRATCIWRGRQRIVQLVLVLEIGRELDPTEADQQLQDQM